MSHGKVEKVAGIGPIFSTKLKVYSVDTGAVHFYNMHELVMYLCRTSVEGGSEPTEW